jgi:hypothetical protein
VCPCPPPAAPPAARDEHLKSRTESLCWPETEAADADVDDDMCHVGTADARCTWRRWSEVRSELNKESGCVSGQMCITIASRGWTAVFSQRIEFVRSEQLPGQRSWRATPGLAAGTAVAHHLETATRQHAMRHSMHCSQAASATVCNQQTAMRGCNGAMHPFPSRKCMCLQPSAAASPPSGKGVFSRGRGRTLAQAWKMLSRCTKGKGCGSQDHGISRTCE